MNELVPIPCPRCGASMIEDASGHLHAAAIARCTFCGTTETLPPDQAERIRFLRLRLLQLRRAAEAAEAPARTLAHVRKAGGTYFAFLLVFAILPLLSGGTVRGAEYAFGEAARDPSVGALVTMLGNLLPLMVLPAVIIGVIVGYLMMLRCFNRAVRPLLTARPPRAPNGRARCRTCGGELAITPAPSVCCSFCQATNLLGAELTTQRAQLLEREAAAHRERAQAFGRSLNEPFKAPAQVFYLAAAVAAAGALLVSSAASVAVVLAQ